LDKTEKILVDLKADSEEVAASIEAAHEAVLAAVEAADLDVVVDSTVAVVLAAVEAAASIEAAAVSEEGSTMDLEKCIQQNVLNVVRTAKFLSNQQKESQFIAKTVLQREDKLRYNKHN
jgi:hypothetical protein